jgi:excisionase family DNA binding protein
MTNPFEILDERLARIEEAILQQPKNAPLPETLLSKKEASNLLGISLNTLDKYCKNKTIPCYGIGSKIMFKKSEVLNSLLRINK